MGVSIRVVAIDAKQQEQYECTKLPQPRHTRILVILPSFFVLPANFLLVCIICVQPPPPSHKLPNERGKEGERIFELSPSRPGNFFPGSQMLT